MSVLTRFTVVAKDIILVQFIGGKIDYTKTQKFWRFTYLNMIPLIIF